MKQIISFAAITVVSIFAGKSQDFNTCSQKCDSQRDNIVSDESPENNVHDEWKTFVKCSSGDVLDSEGNELEGTVQEKEGGIQQADECVDFQALEDPTDDTVHDYWKSRNTCYDKCIPGKMEFKEVINQTWNECQADCIGETYDEPTKTMFYCYWACPDKSFDSLGPLLESGDVTDKEIMDDYIVPYMYHNALCPFYQQEQGVKSCEDKINQENDWQLDTYLENNFDCTSSCTEAPNPYKQETIKFMEEIFECQANCIEKSGSEIDFQEISTQFVEQNPALDESESYGHHLTVSSLILLLLALL